METLTAWRLWIITKSLNESPAGRRAKGSTMNGKPRKKTIAERKPRTWTLHPGEILREEFLVPLQLTAYRLACELHVPVPRINDIIREKRGVSPDTALRLAKFFGTTEQFWLGMQADYDSFQAKKRLRKELAGISRYRSDTNAA